MPPLSFAASTIAYTTRGSAAETERPMRPRSSVGNPLWDLVQVLPPSVERCTDRARPAGDEAARAALPLPGRREQHIGIARVELDVVGAGPVIDLEDAIPGFAAVGGLVDAAIAALSPERTLRSDVHDIGVARIDDDAADVFALFEAEVLPAAAAVNRLVDAIAIRDDALRVGFAGADPDRLGTLGVYGDGTDAERTLAVEYRCETRSTITDFQTPPAAVATYQMCLSRGCTATSAIRPDVNAGPIERNARPVASLANRAESDEAAESVAAFCCAVIGAAGRPRRISEATRTMRMRGRSEGIMY